MKSETTKAPLDLPPPPAPLPPMTEAEAERELLEVQQRVQAYQAEHGYTGPKRVGPKLRNLDELVPGDGAREAEIAAREEAARVATFNSNVATNIAKLVAARGERYRECSLASFRCDTGPQSLAIEKLRAYESTIEQRVKEGEGVFLFGPCGTGKDHLAMALAKSFVWATSQRVAWVCGAMLFQQLRDSFDGKKSEAEVVGPYLNAPLLWISDPLPVKGELTPFQAESLYGLIEARYNARKSVLVTANLNPGEADAVLGPAIARRLRESTIQVHCNWAAYRK